MNDNGDTKMLKEIKSELKDFRQDFNELKMGVVGSKQLGVNGLVQKVAKNTTYIEKDKKFKYGFMGIVGFVTIVGGLLLAFFKLFIQTPK